MATPINNTTSIAVQLVLLTWCLDLLYGFLRFQTKRQEEEEQQKQGPNDQADNTLDMR